MAIFREAYTHTFTLAVKLPVRWLANDAVKPVLEFVQTAKKLHQLRILPTHIDWNLLQRCSGNNPLTAGELERVQAAVRQRMLGLFERRGMLSRETVGVMQGWGHRGGFSVHAGERVAAQDSAGRERLLPYRSLIRRWDGNPALQEWHTRRSVSRRGVAAGGSH